MNGAFAARLHGPGLPDDGVPARAVFAGPFLQVADRGHTVDAATVAVDAAGFNQDDVLLTWRDAAGEFALLVTGADAKAALLAHAPGVLARRLRRWNRSVGFTHYVWRVLASAAALAAVAVGLALWQHERVVAWTAAQIPPETERRLGQGAMAGVRSGGKLVERGLALETVREIGGRLTAGSTRTYEWHLADDPSVNAFAIPGGFIVVHAGLVHAAESAEELAGVLAHEVQHIEQRHTLQNLLYQLGWAAVLTVVLGDPSTLTTLVLLEAGNLKFSRDLEASADAGAVAGLVAAGIRPDGLAEFFGKLGADGAAPDALRWLSTHPATDDRIAAVKAAVAASPCGACQPLPHDWRAVRESLYADGLIRRPADPKP